MKMWSSLLALMLGFQLVVIHAQDRGAKKIMDAAHEKYEQYSSIRLELEVTIAVPERADQHYDAVVTQLDEMFSFISPEQSIYCNGEFVWLHLKERNEVQINNFEEDDELGLITPRDLLSKYRSGEYQYRLAEENKQNAVIEFVPHDRDSEYSKFKVLINKYNNTLLRVQAYLKDGSVATIVIRNMDTNLSVSESDFSFDTSLYPGIFVEDLRID